MATEGGGIVDAFVGGNEEALAKFEKQLMAAFAKNRQGDGRAD